MIDNCEVKNEFLVIHHVGGRAGSTCFDLPNRFLCDIVNVLYDADESCVEQAEKTWMDKDCQTKVYPYCLSDKEGKTKFNLNYDPYTSSIYSLNEKYAKYYYPYKDSGMDYVFGDSVKTMERIEVGVTTLDALVENGKVVAPDFLSIDTQGSELDILKGARQCLENHIFGVFVEVEFVPLYKEQPLFGDICSYLNSLGFELVETSFLNRHPFRGKQGFRGKGVLFDGEALFLKSVDSVTSDLKGRALALNKLGFISLIYNRFEKVQECIEGSGFKKLDNKKYLSVMADIYEALKELPDRSFPVFSERFTYEQSKKRFEVSGIVEQKRIKDIFKKIAGFLGLINFLKSIRLMLGNFKVLFIQTYWKIYIKYGKKMKIGKSRIEKILIENDLIDQYEIAVKNRLIDDNIQKKYLK